MLRLALEGGRLVRWERRRRPPGRGASLHATEACVRAALRSGAFARAFRRQVADIEGLEEAESVLLNFLGRSPRTEPEK
jgi:predicted RNA-binding protein YlxR (DUF448 family)